MLRLLITVAVATGFAAPAIADMHICMVNDTPQTWMQKSGEHAAATMEMAVGPDLSTPVILTIGDDGKFAILFKGPDGKTCVMAVGDHAVIIPATAPGIEN